MGSRFLACRVSRTLTFALMLMPALFSTVTLAAGADEGNPVSEHPTPGWVDEFLETLGADGKFNADKVIDFSLLPGPFYSPEMSLGLGVSAIGLYQVDRDDSVSQLSSLVINGFASTNGSVGMVIENKTFFNEDQQRFYIDAEIYDAPDVFYGVGYDENHQDGNRVEFSSRLLSLRPMWLQRLSQTSFIGAGFDVSYARASDITPAPPPVDTQLLTESSRSAGLNLLLNYDSRDSVLGTKDGRLLQLDYGFYRQALGSEEDFDVLTLLYSEYMRTGRGEDVLAWQVHGRFTDGELPWDRLSLIGGGGLLRGYNSGRYRDNQMLLGQVEYRLDLPWRHGMVFWLGAGAVAAEISEFRADELLPTAGIGYRFAIKPRVNLRLDYGVGDGETGFYFNVNEAF